MYICGKCGCTFERPTVERYDPSPDGISLSGGYYEVHYCPKCGSDDVNEAERCPSCGEWMPYNKAVLCDECDHLLDEGLEKLRHSMGLDEDTFNEAITENRGW